MNFPWTADCIGDQLSPFHIMKLIYITHALAPYHPMYQQMLIYLPIYYLTYQIVTCLVHIANNEENKSTITNKSDKDEVPVQVPGRR